MALPYLLVNRHGADVAVPVSDPAHVEALSDSRLKQPSERKRGVEVASGEGDVVLVVVGMGGL
jgi:hypothetical protein